MTISGIGGAQPPAMQGIDDAARAERMRSVFDAVAQKLGLSTDDLRSALSSGQSLGAVAAAKGVSKDALVATITTALQGNGSSLDASQASALASRIADQKGHHHHHQHHHHDTNASSVSTTAVAASPTPATTAGQLDALA